VCTACSNVRTSRASKGHSKSMRNLMSTRKLERGMADIALEPVDELIHDMVFDMQDMHVTLHRVLEALVGDQRVMVQEV
jgi:uncharacterized protein (UPF0248 family)